ncbi:hypothetical protein [Georgenia sp. Marseille-Q6866]
MTSALRQLLATPTRQFQVVGVLVVAVFAWVSLPVHAGRSWLPRGGLAETFADLTAGDMTTRFVSFYLYLVVWGGIVAICALAVWGAVLGVHSAVGAWRQAVSGASSVPSGDDYVPPILAFWGSVLLGVLTHHVSANVAPVSTAPIWDDVYGASLPAVLLWAATALLTALAALHRAVFSRQGERERERRRVEGRARAAERRAATKDARRVGRDGR